MSQAQGAPSPLRLSLLPGAFAICRLPADTPAPAWAQGGAFVSVTRTEHELSIVCPEASIPPGAPCQAGWRCLRVAGPLDFGLVGVLARLVAPLAAAGVPVFAVSTYDTDYLLVRERDLPRALDALAASGAPVE